MYIDPDSQGDFQPDQITTLINRLQSANFRVLIGAVGSGGPGARAYLSFPSTAVNGNTTIFLRPDSAAIAKDAQTIASSIVPFLSEPQPILPYFQTDPGVQFIIIKSGIDVELFLRKSR